ncbi:MAG: hypothetical protein JO263_03995, partial [Candidatus Eremiobacteraeota bacterium]|nr:hypothetical protein [Candidatus Eremiobacteraeota bacterium]
LTLGFDLAKRNAGERLSLRLRLQGLHLTAPTRRLLQSRLAALDRGEQAAVAAQARRDADVLAAYRQTLAREGDAAVATLSSQLRSKAQVNLALRLGVSRAEPATIVPNLSERVRAFAANLSGARTADAITTSLNETARELPQRFAAVARADRESAAAIAAQIATLQRNRAQLYRSIVAHIGRLAQQLAQRRGLSQVVVAASPPRDSVDVTAALAAMLRNF